MGTQSTAPPGPPNLGCVITSADISTKGTGSYAAEYINWCRVAQLLREHAPGWQFHLQHAEDGSHVWRAPNGTGYVVGMFSGPAGETTPDFPQAVMDNRNAAIPFEKISARDLTDAHRRCLCTAAAATFGLGWQLWVKEPIEDPHRDHQQPQPTAPAPRPTNSRADQEIAAGDAIATSKLTSTGARAMMLQITGRDGAGIEDVPASVLPFVPELVVDPQRVQAWNAGRNSKTGEPLWPQAEEEPADEEPPLAWELPAEVKP